MLDINFSKVLLIIFLSLIIFGPKQLPKIARTLGKFIVTLRQYFNNSKLSLYRHMGIHELYSIKNTIFENSPPLYKSEYQISEDSSLDYSIINPLLNEQQQLYYNIVNNELANKNLYQPELDFTQEPELFDYYYESNINKPTN